MSQLSVRSIVLASITRLSLQTLVAYALAWICLIAGAWAGYYLADWSWLSRSGSLVVIIGIVLTSQQILQHMEYLHHQQLHGLGDRQNLSTRDWASGGDKRDLLDRRFSREVIWRKEAHGFYLLIIGTGVWGFGDLIGGYLFG